MINFNPSTNDLLEIKEWLKRESDKKVSGFYFNWETIEAAFKKGNLVILEQENGVVGFISFSIRDSIVHFDIAEIKSSNRNKNLGTELITECLKNLKQKNHQVVELYCQPESSQGFWRKMGFKDFEIGFNSSLKKMYYSLVETASLSNTSDGKNRIELWDDEPYATEGVAPVWVWELKFKPNTNKLTLGIIHPVNYNWQIQWVQNGRTIFRDKIKRFNKTEIEFGNFIIITELPIETIIL